MEGGKKVGVRRRGEGRNDPGRGREGGWEERE